VRAQRRYDELTAKGDDVTLDEILENVISRDHADMNREISPLRQAEDAIVLDNSHMSVEEQMAWFMERYEAVISR
jgi:cytidylate kinase